MEITPFHRNIAKRIAAGERNKDILNEVEISASRLSILKSKPEFMEVIEYYKNMHEGAYEKAIRVLESEAVEVAQELVKLVKDPNVPEKVRLDACVEILDRIAQAGGHGERENEGNEMMFEQVLRVVKKDVGLLKQGGQEVGNSELLTD